MRPSFLPRLVNGPLFDPVLYLRILNSGKALMMDCGHFLDLSNRELLALDAVCISHAHMDHFMGFDRLLRSILHRSAPLDLYGPPGIIGKTISKLGAYTWNLTQDYGLEIRVHEVDVDRVTRVCARADLGFAPGPPLVTPREGSLVAAHPRYRIDAALLDHRGIPCLAYVVREPFHVGVRRGEPERRGFIPGPWLAALKERILADDLEGDMEVKTAGGAAWVPARELADELTVRTKGEAVAFVTDIAFTEENIEALERLARGVDLLYIEAFYLHDLEGLAREKGHLTASQAGTVASRIGARRAVPMHVSPRYHADIEDILAEMTRSMQRTR